MTSETTTTLPELDGHYELSPEQIAEYQANGHVCLRGVLTPSEIETFREQILEATTEPRAAADDLSQRDTYGKAFLQMMNLWQNHAGVQKLVFSERLARIAAQLMGASGTRLYHDQALFKEASGGFTPWHQDQYYWPLDTPMTTTIWMPLIDLTQEMGIMKFASKSQLDGYLPQMGEISDESESRIDAHVEDAGLNVTGETAMKAGDATFHSGWTLHRAPSNQTETMREVITIIYFPDGTRILEPDHENRRVDLKTWLVGRDPGDLADGELNPLLYSRDPQI